LELAARLTANELDDIYCLVATGDLYVDLEKSLLRTAQMAFLFLPNV